MSIYGKIAVTEEIVRKAALDGTLDAVLETGEILLTSAIMGLNGEMAKLIVDLGGNINARGRKSETALHKAVALDNLYLAGKLLNWGADINARDEAGATPLIRACEKGLKHMAQFLIVESADIDIKDNRGRSALDCTTTHVNTDIFDSLMAEKAIPSAYALERSVFLRYPLKVTALLKRGANPNQPYENGDTPLIIACRASDDRIVDVLLKHGARVSTSNKHGYTATDYARRNRRYGLSMTKLLENNKKD